jgi:hypothetical protein
VPCAAAAAAFLQTCGFLCRLMPRISCVTGASYDAVVAALSSRQLTKWAARSCYPYVGDASESCFPVNGGACSSQLPTGKPHFNSHAGWRQ